MSTRKRRALLALPGLLFFALSAILSAASAQEGGQARLAPVETAAFPRITSYLDVRNGDGDFVYGLSAGDLRILENGETIQVSELSVLRPGAQLVLAVNPGPSFAIRDSQGFSRYDYLVQALQTWAEARQGSTLDDLSLLVPDEPGIAHQPDVQAWSAALPNYGPDVREAVPNFDLLSQALEMAADPTGRPGMGKAVLFITSLPDGDLSVALQSMASRASRLGVRVFIWLVASPEQVHSPNGTLLADLAVQTGGALFAYSGAETIPSIEEYLEPLRSTYFLAYDSQIETSGVHRVAVRVNTGDMELTSLEQEFELEVLPPSVNFISPPVKIERKSLVEDSQDPGSLSPRQQTLEVVVEFPDGHKRPLERSTLYVDGAIADENQAPPYDRFNWDLSKYSTSGQHVLMAEVVDNLGLSNRSAELPVLIQMARPTQTVLTTFSRNRTLVAGLIVVLAGSVLLLVLVVGGRIQPGSLTRLRRRRRRSTDPVTQPVKVKNEPGGQRLGGLINRLQWPHRRLNPKAFAYLVRLSVSGEGDGFAPISITSEEITFGRDNLQATHVLDDPSVEALHTRLVRERDGSFRLLDEGSTAGTWINYTPVSKEGTRLEHGDLIHVGRVGFRFTLREPQKVRKPVITPKESKP